MKEEEDGNLEIVALRKVLFKIRDIWPCLKLLNTLRRIISKPSIQLIE